MRIDRITMKHLLRRGNLMLFAPWAQVLPALPRVSDSQVPIYLVPMRYCIEMDAIRNHYYGILIVMLPTFAPDNNPRQVSTLRNTAIIHPVVPIIYLTSLSTMLAFIVVSRSTVPGRIAVTSRITPACSRATDVS